MIALRDKACFFLLSSQISYERLAVSWILDLTGMNWYERVKNKNILGALNEEGMLMFNSGGFSLRNV